MRLLPGAITPAFRMAATDDRSRCAAGLEPLWHLRQCALKIGAISWVKSTVDGLACGGNATAMPKTSDAARQAEANLWSAKIRIAAGGSPRPMTACLVC